MVEMTEEEASKTEAVDDLEEIEEIEEAIKEEVALMAPEETLVTDPEDASIANNKAIWSRTVLSVILLLVSQETQRIQQ